MRVVGLDGGDRRIGVALSDPLGLTAQPLATVERGTDSETVARLRVALADVDIDLIVVGLPLRLDGSEGGAARKARRLAELVGRELGAPTTMWDERLTTAQAERLLVDAGLRRARRKGPTDRVAAAIMLQSFLDSRCRDDE